MMEYEAVIGLEIHAELETKSKMFCACPVVDSTQAAPNTAVCPVCAGMPGVLPVVNQKAVEYGLRVALALECEIAPLSIFARKNYFYPDLPKGYQISQYEQPLARNGRINILTSQGERTIRIRRVHLEEDTGKLTHVPGEETTPESPAGENATGTKSRSLIDLNRAGIPLLEIVSEPDLHTAEEVRAYAMALHAVLRYLEVNSGDMQKGVMRIEPNVSVRPKGSQELGTRTEIKNLNSFRALERAVNFEIQRQSDLLERGQRVVQETRGWDDVQEITLSQRSKEEAHDYRYFPEPDLPPLVVEKEWVASIQAALPELPDARLHRFQQQYSLNAYDAAVLVTEKAVGDYFEETVAAVPGIIPKVAANWIMGDLFGLLNQAGDSIEAGRISPQALANLLHKVTSGEVNQATAKSVLAEMYQSGKSAEAIIIENGLQQISDQTAIAALVQRVLAENPGQVAAYLAGKETLSRWFFGQVMRASQGQANPQIVQQELEQTLKNIRA